jgi:hypothetical protein
MRRRTWIRAVLLLVAVAATAVAVAAAVLKQEPGFYTDPAVVAARADDPYRASDVQTRLSDLKRNVFADAEWSGTFTADDLNAFFREDPAMNNLVEPRLGGLTAPRVAVDGDRLRLAARYGCGFWSTVVSAELRAWVIADEPNLFAVEVLSFRAGGLPLAKRMFMERVNRFADENYLSVSWFRSDGNPVAVCRWLPNQSRPSTLLQTIAIGDGRVAVGGRNLSGR